MRVITNPLLTEQVQYSRSLGRSARRARMGHRQHFATRPSMKAIKVGDTLVMHPASYDAFKKMTASQQAIAPASPVAPSWDHAFSRLVHLGTF